MSTQSTLMATAYRQSVALAAANGTAISALAFMAFGTGDDPYDPENNTALQNEVLRLPLLNVTAQGPTVRAIGLLSGTQAGVHVIREAGVFTASGVLVGRRLIGCVELISEAELEIEIEFEY